MTDTPFITDEDKLDFLRRELMGEGRTVDSVMLFENLCEHDDHFLCHHRVNWIINYVKGNFLSKAAKIL